MTLNMELYFAVKRPRDFLEWTLQITPLAGGYILAQDQGRGQRPPDVLALGRSLREEGPRSPLLLVLQRLGGHGIIGNSGCVVLVIVAQLLVFLL